MRRELARRPSIAVLIALVGGLLVREHPFFLLLPLLALWLPEGNVWRAFSVVGWVGGFLLAPVEAPRITENEPFRGEATITETPQMQRERIRVRAAVAGRLYTLTAPREPLLAAGDRVRVVGELRPLSPDSAELPVNRPISGLLRAKSVEVLDRGPWIYGLGARWRASFLGFAGQGLSPRASAMAGALCFNYVDGLTEDTYSNLQRTGTVHIVSASGLHVLIFAAGLNFALSFFPIPRGGRLALAGLVLLIYAVGAGMNPPIVRSVAMAFLLGAASFLRREPDLLSALAATAIGYLLWEPAAVFDIGFQLSFAAVAGLWLFLGPLDDSLPTEPVARLRRGVVDVAKASLVATLATAPLTAYYFGTVSLISVFANVLIALVLPFITLSAFAAHLLGFLWEALGVGLMSACVGPLSGWVYVVADLLGPLPFAAVSLPAFSAWWILPYYALMLSSWRPRARPA